MFFVSKPSRQTGAFRNILEIYAKLSPEPAVNNNFHQVIRNGSRKLIESFVLETRKQNTIKMALEAMHGFSKKSFTGNENFGLLGDEEDLDINRELAAAFPNSAEPMSILTPPFVS